MELKTESLFSRAIVGGSRGIENKTGFIFQKKSNLKNECT
jgi:hypothetical protein